MPPRQRAFDSTPLRLSYERARIMDTPGQLRECIDVLENPEILASEVLESFRSVARAFEQGVLEPETLDATTRLRAEADPEPEWIYEGRDLSVLGDPCSFTCLSSNVEPIPRGGSSGADGEAKQPTRGLDFVGITCSAAAAPVLGTVQSDLDASAYPLLLRALAGLAEMAPAVQLRRLNRQCFKRALRPSPRFDLLLVTWIFDENAERTPISQLTRDISELAKRAIVECGDLRGILGDIVCLRMNPGRFDGRMRFDWRV